MISLKSDTRVLAFGVVIGMAVAVAPVFAQDSIVPSDFAVADYQEPQAVVAPLPPVRSAVATPRTAPRTAAAAPARRTVAVERVAYVEQSAVARRAPTSGWLQANRPYLMFIGNVY